MKSDPPGSSASHERWKYSSELHCADCDIAYRDPVPSLFSFNSPVGACETCRGFGRIIGIDYGLVIPDETKTLAGGAIKPWQTKSYKECQDDLVKFAKKRGIPLDTPWYALTEAQRKWVIEGEGKWEKKVWYGAKRFFEWLETKAYKMHVRVLLSRYRAYTPCTACGGSRLKPDALLWRVAGLNVHDLMLLPLDARAHVLRRARRCRRRSTRPRTCCWPRCARASPTCARWGWDTSRSTASRARSRAAKCSAST